LGENTYDKDIDTALTALKNEEVILVPTETVYGLAGDAKSVAAVKKIFEIKMRPRDVSLPVMLHTVDEAINLTDDDRCREQLSKLGSRFWPGPLTVVVPLKDNSPLAPFQEQKSVGIRCPDHDLLLSLLDIFGPLAVTSANLHGGKPIETADEAKAIFGDQISYIDGGLCQGKPSTVVSLLGTKPTILRQGSISAKEILAALKTH